MDFNHKNHIDGKWDLDWQIFEFICFLIAFQINYFFLHGFVAYIIKKWIFTPCLNTALHHVLTKRDTETNDKILLTLMRISALNSCAHDKRR